MNRPLLDGIVRATLYEGYILYPYRPSVKNRQRWSFGGLYPTAWIEAGNDSDASTMQTECLIRGDANGTLRVVVRCLQLIDRTVGQAAAGTLANPVDARAQVNWVQSLEIGGKRYQAWQEAAEREVEAEEIRLADLVGSEPRRVPFSFPARQWTEDLRASDGTIAGILAREQRAIEGEILVSVDKLGDDLHRARVVISNRTALPMADTVDRDRALLHALVSTHTILEIRGGEFVSMIDPPAQWQTQAAQCRNIGAWPVLVGHGFERDTLLSSPIILYDYPQLAPQSPGDLFDATEIDEILTLRILTLTEDEKREAAGMDDRVRDLMSRTESLAREQLMDLHGAMRGLRPIAQEQHHG